MERRGDQFRHDAAVDPNLPTVHAFSGRHRLQDPMRHLARGDRAFARRALENYHVQRSALDADPDSANVLVERLLESAGQWAAVRR